MEELTDIQIKKLKELQLLGKVIYVDPGKKNILYMMNDKGIYFRYSISERISETGRLKYQLMTQKYKDRNGISEKEHELSGYNSKSCNLDDFKAYIKEKNKVNVELINKYKEGIFRKYKWYLFINTKRSEDNLLNKIEKVFGKDLTLVYGDWSTGKQMRNFISTPNKGIKRKLNTRFEIYSIDEFKTSLISNKTINLKENTYEENTNMYLPDKNGILRKKHSILTFTMENKRLGCINRDKNSVRNMKLLTEYFINHKDRPEMFKRSKKTKDLKINPNNKKSQNNKIKSNFIRKSMDKSKKTNKINRDNVKPLMSSKSLLLVAEEKALNS